MPWWADLLISIGAALLLVWVVVVVALFRSGRGLRGMTEAARLLPDLVRLLSRLARDPGLPRGVRIRLWLLLGYLASPIDLIPDFIPVLGDAPSLALSLYQLAVARRLGVPRSVRVRMGINIGIDTLVGGVPVLGDLVDTLFKVHLRNQRLIDAYLQRTRSG